MNEKSKFAFFGTPEFAAIVLEKLIQAGWPPTLIVCNPDRPVGRKKIITPPLTKILAEKYGIKVWQPEKLETDKLDGAEFAVIASYNKIIPQAMLDSLPAKFIGVHPSLLPKYRGPSPIQSAILNGEKETGVALFLLDEKVDHGPILATRKLEMRNSDFETLSRQLAELGGDFLVEILPKFLNGEIIPQPQNENDATYTKKFKTEDAYVDLTKDDPIIIERKTRALNPEPGVWTVKDGKRMKILEAELTPDNKLKLKKIQFEGKNPQMV